MVRELEAWWQHDGGMAGRGNCRGVSSGERITQRHAGGQTVCAIVSAESRGGSAGGNRVGAVGLRAAGDPQVKQFGAQMIEDHRKARAEIQQLASKEGVPLPTELTSNHKEKQEQFARLSGRDFDRAYLGFMLRDHRRDVKEFERHIKAI